MQKTLLYGLAGLLASCAAPPERPGAAASDAGVPAASYRSAFEGYAGFQEQELADWRQVNDEVGRLGGHRGALRP